MHVARRSLLFAAAGSSALAVGGLVARPATAADPAPTASRVPVPPSGMSPKRLAGYEPYWRQVASHYAMTRKVTNLENGMFGANPRAVRESYADWTERIQHENSWYMRNEYPADADQARSRLARALGCDVGEVAFTRGATEALQTLIGGYRLLKPGDQVGYVDLDYDSMQYAMQWLRDRRGAEVVTAAIPEPATREAVLATYRRLLDDHPRLRLLLLTHLSHRTGLVMPIAEITEMAEKRGVDVIVDAAHSWGQLDFHVTDLKAPFVGFNLHKWIGAPLGGGAIYIRADRLTDIDRHYGDRDWPAGDIRSRIHTGTVNAAAWLAVPAALDFHDAIGAANKEHRLRYLRDRWAQPVRSIPKLQILTPEDPRMYGAITSFRIGGNTTPAQNSAITKYLLDEWGVFTVRRGGIARGDAIRVTPALYNTPADSDRLAAAVRAASAKF
ncbi:aminotransferase class V-fold PLP-dependent enzyme [Spirillospora sp. CA-255316]